MQPEVPKSAERAGVGAKRHEVFWPSATPAEEKKGIGTTPAGPQAIRPAQLTTEPHPESPPQATAPLQSLRKAACPSPDLDKL